MDMSVDMVAGDIDALRRLGGIENVAYICGCVVDIFSVIRGIVGGVERGRL